MMKTQYKLRCMECGQRFKTTRYLAKHQRDVHQKHAQVKKQVEQKQKELSQLKRKLPGKGLNILALIIFVIIIILFIYFVYLR